MIPLLYISFIIFLFSLTSLIPYHSLIEKKFKIKKNSEFNHTLNLLIFLNLLLALSIFNLTIVSCFIILLITSIFTLFVSFNKITPENIKINFLIFFISILFSIDLIFNLELYWDAQKIWLNKTIIFFNNGTIENIEESIRPNYPLLGSLIWSFFWKLSNSQIEYFGRIFYIIIFLCSIWYFSLTINKKLHTKIAVFLFSAIIIYDSWHFRGTQEILVFSFSLICASSIYLIQTNRNCNIFFVIYLLSFNLLIWTKNEAIIFAILLNIILFYQNIKLKKLKNKFILIPFVFIIFRFLVFKFYNFELNLSKDFDYFNILEIFYKNLKADNILLISKHFVISFFKFPYILIGIIALLALNLKTLKQNKIYLLYLLLNICVLYIIYLSTKVEVAHMVTTGLNRLIFESFPIILVFVAIYLNSKKSFEIKLK